MSTCCSISRPYTWRDRLRNKLFPHRICEEPEAPKHFKDALVIRVTAELSFMDRLRVLISGRLLTETRTLTENMMGQRSKTASMFRALPPRFWDRNRLDNFTVHNSPDASPQSGAP